MSSIIKNNSNYDLSQLTSLVNEYYPYAKKAMGFNNDPAIIFESDLDNAANPLGKTAYYNPSDSSVTIYVDNRHPKDIMRSLNHELVHHKQNCQGKFENLGPTEEGYAQSDPYLREMEEEAYKDMTFRDWENQRNIKEKKTMNLNEEKLRAVIREAIEKALGKQANTETTEEAVTENDEATVEENEENLEEVTVEACAAEEAEEVEEIEEATDTEKEVNEDQGIPMSIDGVFSPNNYSVTSQGVNDTKEIEEGEGAYNRDEKETEEVEEVVEEVTEEATEEFTEKTEEESTETLKEWYNGSLYGKLLKQYTKKR